MRQWTLGSTVMLIASCSSAEPGTHIAAGPLWAEIQAAEPVLDRAMHLSQQPGLRTSAIIKKCKTSLCSQRCCQRCRALQSFG